MMAMSEPTSREWESIDAFLTKTIGPWRAILEGKEQWENVTRHCMLEAARASIFADLLKFDPELKKDLVLASVLHDGNKRYEIMAIQQEMKEGGSGFIASNGAMRTYISELQAKKVPERAIALISSVGGMPEVLIVMKHFLDQPTLTDNDIAMLVVHYIDDYTRDGMWVEPVIDNLNDIDRRAEKNRNNPNYHLMDLEISKIFHDHPFFAGKPVFDAMVIVSHMIEERLSGLVAERNNIEIQPLYFPEVMDAMLFREINQSS